MKRTNLSVMGVSIAVLYLVMTVLSLIVLYLAILPMPPTLAPAARIDTGHASAGNIMVSGVYVQATQLNAPIPTEATMGGMNMSNGDAADIALVSGAYLLIQNRGNQGDKLISVACDAAGTATLHQSVIKNDVASMQMLASLDIPAGGSTELKPGGYHIMLMSLKHPLVVGQTVELTLSFASGTILTVQAPIVAP